MDLFFNNNIAPKVKVHHSRQVKIEENRPLLDSEGPNDQFWKGQCFHRQCFVTLTE